MDYPEMSFVKLTMISGSSSRTTSPNKAAYRATPG